MDEITRKVFDGETEKDAENSLNRYLSDNPNTSLVGSPTFESAMVGSGGKQIHTIRATFKTSPMILTEG